jgi:M6 family metalloprotease-like protein
MKKALPLWILIWSIAPLTAVAQPVPPSPGVGLPQGYFDRIAQDKTAFQFQKAWIEKTKRAKEAREKFMSSHPEGMTFAALPDEVKRAMMVSGTAQVPVLLGKYANTAADPYPAATLQTKLFSAPPAMSMTALYDEMSYGALNLTGTVYGWYQVSQNDTQYEGGAGCYGLCGSAKTGQYILEVLELADPSVNFGTYDNDGPDGIPNSGDDDGFVDFVAIVQPEIGAECGNNNLWSHRWVVGGWPEFAGNPWTTDDARTGGGFIQVWDYTIQPAKGSTNGCGSGVIEIGVFCHEFGHAFGLPDLYDWDGGQSEGVGHWSLMGSGNWNRPPNPSHMDAWCKSQLGWVAPIDVGPQGQIYAIDNVETNPEVFKLDVREEKFSRKLVLASYRMHCGLTQSEAVARGWLGGAGYGNSWDESIEHEFPYDGTGPVSFECDYMVQTEPDYDFGYLKIDVNGTVTTLAQFDDFAVGHAIINLAPFLEGSGATSYRLIVEFQSDVGVSDEDGVFDSQTAGPFSVDNVLVFGGGVNYFANFEQNEDGWHYADSVPTKEYFLVENRDTTDGAFDKFLHNRGLAVWHIEQDMMARGGLGTSGGAANTVVRGVTLEEADGQDQVLTGQNRGDAGDVFPGTSANTTFNTNSIPSSRSFNDAPTNVAVENIGPAGPQMSAWLRSGFFPPAAALVTPHVWYNDREPIEVSVVGDRFVHGATFMLRDSGQNDFPASPVEWLGKTGMLGTLDVSGLPKGTYDFVVRNPDGQESVLPGAFEVRSIVPVFIQAFGARATDEGIELAWEIWSDENVEGFKISRREKGSELETNLLDGRLLSADRREFIDDTVEPAAVYEYFLTVVLAGNEQRSSGVSAKSVAFELGLRQNVPNPFNPDTRIAFSLPSRMHVVLAVHDVAGRRVITLIDGSRPAGINDVLWNGRDSRGSRVASGVYFYRLEAGGRSFTRKMLLLK